MYTESILTFFDFSIDTSRICFNAPTKQWLQVVVDNDTVIYFLFSFISSLDLMPLISCHCSCLLKQIREISIVFQKQFSLYSLDNLFSSYLIFMQVKEIVSYMDTATAKDIIYRWSVTQSQTVSKQLESGIRYLDMRVSFNHTDREM